jgi:hypothetical protein
LQGKTKRKATTFAHMGRLPLSHIYVFGYNRLVRPTPKAFFHARVASISLFA